MAYRSSFPPVYPGLNDLPESEVTSATPRFLAADANLLRSIAASTSIITHICQHAIRDAAEYCRTHNIESFADQQRLVDYLRQRSLVGAADKTAGEDVAGRNQNGSQLPAAASGQRTEARAGVAGGSRTGSGKAGTAKGSKSR